MTTLGTTQKIASFQGFPCQVTAEIDGAYQLRAVSGYPFVQLPYTVTRGRTNEATVAAAEVAVIEKTGQIIERERRIAGLEEERARIGFRVDALVTGSNEQADALVEWFDAADKIRRERDALVIDYEWALMAESHQADDAKDQELSHE